jgi:dTDP-glucose 4,6-dehydratase
MVDLSNSKILCTGGLGFIGSNFIELLMKKYKNLTIYNYDKKGIGSRELYSVKTSNMDVITGYNNTYKWILGDLTWEDFRAASIKNILRENQFDYIFHFAAESHVDRSIEGPTFFVENNVLGMVNLLEGIRQYQPKTRLINVSTDEVYGHLRLDDRPFTEESPFTPRSPYAASKASADLIANSYVSTYGLDIVTTHCCNNFGPHQGDEKFIPTIIRHLVNGTKIPVYGEGKNIREWIYVEDHNKALLEIAEDGESGNRYNIGSGEERDNIEMISNILKIYSPNIPDYAFADELMWNISFVEDRKGHDFRYAINSLNYSRNFKMRNFEDVLREVVYHYTTKYSK